MQIIRNISTEQRFFEIIKSMPNPVMNLYSGAIFYTDTFQNLEVVQNLNLNLKLWKRS